MKRRHAVHKINSLPEATEAQLAVFDDVCAICYQELTSARITRCNHYFHGVCLRKWLYVQDICPLCHETLYVMTDETKAEATAGPGRAIPMPAAGDVSAQAAADAAGVPIVVQAMRQFNDDAEEVVGLDDSEEDFAEEDHELQQLMPAGDHEHID